MQCKNVYSVSRKKDWGNLMWNFEYIGKPYCFHYNQTWKTDIISTYVDTLLSVCAKWMSLVSFWSISVICLKYPISLYWKFPVGSKMILLIFDMLEAFKNSEKNRISLFHVTLPIWIIKPSTFKGFSKLERIIIMVFCIFK